MKNLASLNKYFVKYKWRLLLGLLFVSVSNVFAVMSPVVVRDVLDKVQQSVGIYNGLKGAEAQVMQEQIFSMVLWNGLLLLGLALARGVFMFFMRQTIIVMSRLIEYDQKSEIFNHYQELHTQFL